MKHNLGYSILCGGEEVVKWIWSGNLMSALCDINC